MATLLTFGWIKTLFYEVFAKVHSAAAPLLIVSLWWHAGDSEEARVLLVVSASLWSVSHILTWSQRLFRNFGWNRNRTKVLIRQEAGVLHITALVCRSWTVRAGQFVYLSVPTVSLSSLFQHHPFVITNWVRNQEDGSVRLHLLVKPKRGFTSALSSFTDTYLSATIDGPYGVTHNLGEYGTVFMFATGIGAVSHFPYIRELIRSYRRCEVRTRRIVLVWQPDIDGTRAHTLQEGSASKADLSSATSLDQRTDEKSTRR